MEIQLNREYKLYLLKAIKKGVLETSVFKEVTREHDISLQDIAEETVRLEKIEGDDYLLKRADLMRQFAQHQITDEEYISELIKYNRLIK